jgi:acyl carrier protein
MTASTLDFSTKGQFMDRTQMLLDYVKDELARGRAPNLKASDDLLSAGILDSLGILQMVAYIDKQFGIQIPDEDVVFENFYSIEALSDYLTGLEQ